MNLLHTSLLFIILTSNSLQISFAQNRLISFKDLILKDSIPNQQTLEVADSLLMLYNKAPFKIGDANESKLDGLIYINYLYTLSAELNPENKRIKEQIVDNLIRMKVDSFLFLENKYTQIINTADSLFTIGKTKEAELLFHRALQLKPSDLYVKSKLNELNE